MAAEAEYAHVDCDRIAVEVREKLFSGSLSSDERMAALSELEHIKPEVRLEQLTKHLLEGSDAERENALMGIVFSMTFLTALLRGYIEYNDENKNTVISSVIFSASRHVRARALTILKEFSVEPTLIFLDAPLAVLEKAIASRPTDTDALLQGGLDDPRLVRMFVERSHPYRESEGWPRVLRLQREAVRSSVPIAEILSRIH